MQSDTTAMSPSTHYITYIHSQNGFFQLLMILLRVSSLYPHSWITGKNKLTSTVELLNADLYFGCTYPFFNIHLKPPPIHALFNVSILTTVTKNNGKLEAKFFSSDQENRSPVCSLLSLISKCKLCMHSGQNRLFLVSAFAAATPLPPHTLTGCRERW